MKATIFDIQRFSLHDGPGIRTTVFFKGCNLRCKWCHNPESIDLRPEIQHYSDKCIGCGECITACEHGAHRFGEASRIFDRDLCVRCGKCVKACFSGALEIAGEDKTVDDIMDVVMRDKPFYKGNGGLTCSGGEPLLQAAFVRELLAVAKENGMHTAVDTAGNVPFDSLESVLPYADLILYDIKAADEKLHIEATGVRNDRIKKNLASLCAEKINSKIWIRIPCIPGVAGGREEMTRITEMLSDILASAPGRTNIELIELLNYHGLGGGKYENIGMNYSLEDIRPLPKEDMEALGDIVGELDIPVKIS